jgi:hypothetical protein
MLGEMITLGVGLFCIITFILMMRHYIQTGVVKTNLPYIFFLGKEYEEDDKK